MGFPVQSLATETPSFSVASRRSYLSFRELSLVSVPHITPKPMAKPNASTNAWSAICDVFVVSNPLNGGNGFRGHVLAQYYMEILYWLYSI